MFGDGHGNFTPLEVVGPEGGVIATGDINGDGLPDVVVPDFFNLVSVALGRTDRNYPSVLSLTPETATLVSVGNITATGCWTSSSPETALIAVQCSAIRGTIHSSSPPLQILVPLWLLT
jgi:hypothetical protein